LPRVTGEEIGPIGHATDNGGFIEVSQAAVKIPGALAEQRPLRGLIRAGWGFLRRDFTPKAACVRAGCGRSAFPQR
jgi:hypothetical protein